MDCDRWSYFVLFGLLGLFSFFGKAAAAPAGPVAPEVQSIDHSPWTATLQRFVNDAGLVDYRGLAQDRAVFDAYVKLVETVSPENRPDLFPSRNHELAFYLNAYNAITWKGVVDRGPEEESVWKGAISGLNFFKLMKIQVGGRTTNLSDFENDVIRARYQDPRVHAALNCASIGCPKLVRAAFLPETLDAQLDDAVRQWVATPYHVEPDPAQRKVRVNKIFDWFEGDFVGEDKKRGAAKASVIGWINRYRAADAQIPADFKLEINDYDKRVNKQ